MERDAALALLKALLKEPTLGAWGMDALSDLLQILVPELAQSTIEE